MKGRISFKNSAHLSVNSIGVIIMSFLPTGKGKNKANGQDKTFSAPVLYLNSQGSPNDLVFPSIGP